MKFTTLTVKLIGPLWHVREFEIESINVLSKWEEDKDGNGLVTVEDFTVSDDNILDVYIHLSAPNSTVYQVTMEAKLISEDGTSSSITYDQKFAVVRNGDLKIQITENIDNLKSE